MRLLLILLMMLNAWSGQIKLDYKDYEDAQKAEYFLKFESESTKMGIVTTSFDGYVKKLDNVIEVNNGKLNGLTIKFNGAELVTGNDSRDEKMMEKILEVNKYPSIEFTSNQVIFLMSGTQTINGKLTIRNAVRKVNLSVKIEKVEGHWVLIGETSFGLKEFNIPDPSIMIASVRDRFDIKFKVKLSE